MNCAYSCMKWILFLSNFLFSLGGLTILVLGVLALSSEDVEVISKANPDIASFTTVAYALILVGAIIFIITFFGCCGAIRESHCMIVTYGVLLLTLLVIQVAIGSYIFIKFKGEDAEKSINESVEKLFKSYWEPNTSDAIKGVINNLEKFGHCCGFNSYRDYLNNSNNPTRIIPGSCCNRPFNESCSPDQAEPKGCKTELFTLFSKSANTLGTVALSIAGIELIGIIFSFCLANSILNVERRGYKV